ncbi:Hypothetical predicted protein [Olea europaea subsp. europaea]|uniref:PGG domain-containing protein n=1 Tax=Olea europaea subsp. europaea TaxID=158383 RepID=A0A8S0PIK6_OLEEU|nr:Hypothetical predicted protein [Olea europaea subsp. europaea]
MDQGFDSLWGYCGACYCEKQKCQCFRCSVGLDSEDKQRRNTELEERGRQHSAASTNHPQVLRLLVKNVNNINDKNSQNMTALDIAMSLPAEMNTEIKNYLHRAGASRASSLHRNVSLADFMGSQERIVEKFVRYDVYMRKGQAREMRNALLVVAILIATTTYQAVLSPPGGLKQAETTTNTTMTGGNATSKSPSSDRPGTVALSLETINPFLYLNPTAFIGSVGLILFTIQNSRYSLLLQVSIIFLMLSYMASVRAISPPSKVAAYAVIVSSILFIYARILGSSNPALRWFFGSKRLQMQQQIVNRKYSSAKGLY